MSTEEWREEAIIAMNLVFIMSGTMIEPGDWALHFVPGVRATQFAICWLVKNRPGQRIMFWEDEFKQKAP